MGIRLSLHVIVLMPAYLRMAWFYWIAANRTVVRYDTQSVRQTMDVYYPTNCSPDSILRQHSVVFFCPGGAWMIGYKMWGALTARFLVATGCIVVIPDYHNYPWGTVPQAVNDVVTALRVTQETIGTVNVAVGQSAGGHLLLTALLQSKLDKQDNVFEGVDTVMSLSAPLSLDQISFDKYGLESTTLDSMFEGKISDYDPIRLQQRLKDMEKEDLVSAVGKEEAFHQAICDPAPTRIAIVHGTADATVPIVGSIEMAEMMGIPCKTYSGWSHTDPILEGPMDGDHQFHRDIVSRVASLSDRVRWPDEDDPVFKPLAWHWQVQLGRFFMPF